ncbi:hypothetical protein R3P38DRAFT_3102155, partial [Favolaschia claudopus]
MCLWTSYLRLHALSRYIRSGFMLAVISRLVPGLHAFMDYHIFHACMRLWLVYGLHFYLHLSGNATYVYLILLS